MLMRPVMSTNLRTPVRPSRLLFAARGALVAKKDSQKQRRSFAPRWGDSVVAVLTVLFVRLMVRGIPFVP